MSGRVGLVGLGVMGRAVAARLTAAGVPVVATSRTPATREAAAAAVPGLVVLGEPASVAAAGPALVLTCLPSGVEVASVATQLVAGLPAGRSLLLVDLSTTAPAEAAALHERLRAGGHRVIDAPVSGGPTGASAGTLSIMAGAVEADLREAEPILAHLGTVVHCGPPGSGQVAKACNQLVVASTLVAVAEALTLAARSGADPALVRAALLGGYAASRVLELQGERMLRGDFEGRGKAGLLAKDVGIIRRLAGEAALGTPVLDAAGAIVDRLAARDPDIDHSAVITIIEEMVP
ncbi:NAD(P)-dependent oxidoreductase [Phytohabitans aurantiacus]|uniref:NADPH nitroreductase n=1 Tax=Phytohabitans aurantiacus TaxID=3016789 RepID=A0ABQ5QQ23_9ACTN|nr:NAD(P)-dependent oxidoreductase [Phytohabitans aurantiacus]GLH96067.1 NADPH nitroreductase [Phytohabitans aurantiacus]